MKLEDAKELQNIFESNLNNILKRRFKSEEQKSVLKSINYFTNQGKLLLNHLMNTF